MFQRIKSSSGFNIYFHPTTKFKTTTIRIFFKGSLASDVEEQALLPFILKRGSEGFPTLKKISRYLETLYGSGFSMDISKLAENQIFVASMDIINARFVKNQPELLFDAIALMNDVLTNPLLENGVFLKDRFEQEKLNLTRYIKSVIDDKAAYAHIRLIREIYKNEPFGNYEWGDIDKLSKIEHSGAYHTYRKILKQVPVDVYIVGQLTDKEIEALPSTLLPLTDREIINPKPSGKNQLYGDTDVIIEEQPIEQSKLEIGYKVDIDCSDDDYYALSLYGAILGGGAFSKLFKKVREKESLAYYIFSSFDKLKGFLRVAAGIDTGNFDKVLVLVQECMDEIAQGRISDEEFTSATNSFLSSLRSIPDSPGNLIEFDIISRVSGRNKTIEELKNYVRNMTKDRVSSVAKYIHPSKTFLLKGTGISNDTIPN